MYTNWMKPQRPETDTLTLLIICPQAQHPGLSATSLWPSAGSQDSKTSQTFPSAALTKHVTSEIVSHKDEPSSRTKDQSIRSHWTICSQAWGMKMMHWLLLLLQYNATQGLREWHKRTTHWFTCGSHSLAATYPIQIQIRKPTEDH